MPCPPHRSREGRPTSGLRFRRRNGSTKLRGSDKNGGSTRWPPMEWLARNSSENDWRPSSSESLWTSVGSCEKQWRNPWPALSYCSWWRLEFGYPLTWVRTAPLKDGLVMAVLRKMMANEVSHPGRTGQCTGTTSKSRHQIDRTNSSQVLSISSTVSIAHLLMPRRVQMIE